MPPKKSRKKDKTEAVEATPDVRVVREVRSSDFSTAELHARFTRHVTNAQDAYLKGDNETAEKEGTAALQIKPTSSIFALLSVIAESRGQFDRASDFRLLQAFLARDALLWEELLHDFLSQQLFYKSVVCLQRMSALEQNPARYRALQFQLADLLIGLGEIRRATHVLVPLWNSSKCRDFEVFALLSSLYFQLGKWSSLQRLITSSLKNSFDITLPPGLDDDGVDGKMAAAADQAERTSGGVNEEGPKANEEKAATTKTKRVSKRVRFFGVDNEEEEEDEAQRLSKRDAGVPFPSVGSPTPTTASPGDDFSFDELESSAQSSTPNNTSGGGKDGSGGVVVARAANGEAAAAKTAVQGLYGTSVKLVTPTQKRNFLTLVNVHAELLNEGGKFAETVQLLEFTASALQVEILDLPPDLLVRLGTAHAFLGGPENEQPCREIFQSLVETCSMEEYGDVLLDAALSLQKVGMHPEAHRIFETFARYYQSGYGENVRQMAEAQAEVDAARRSSTSRARPRGSSGGTEDEANMSLAAVERLQSARQRLARLQVEHDEMKTVMSAAYAGSASSLFALRRVDAAEAEARKALEADPTHLHVRLLLGKIYFYHRHNLRAAIDVLTPKESEPALQRIQLGAALVRVFFKSHMYIESIALGVSLFEIILASSEDGDADSVAPGSSRRSAAPLLMPTMSRASSAIIPASTLMSTAGGGTVAGSVGRLSASLAASIRAGTSVYKQQFTRRGRAALTTTVYGASAAASVAAGWAREDEEGQLQDSSTIFRFHRKRQPRTRGSGAGKGNGDNPAPPPLKEEEDAEEGEGDRRPAMVGEVEGAEEDGTAEVVERRRCERRQAVAAMDASAFWESPADGLMGGDGEGEAPTTGAGCDKASQAHQKGLGSATTVGERDRSLEELEALGKGVECGGDDAPAPESYELPSLEEISKRFNDPAMAQLFLEASSHAPKAGATEEGQGLLPPLGGAGGEAAAGGELAGASAVTTADRVTFREAITALGRMEFMNLTVTVVDAYSALGKFTEAKEFAFLALSRIGGNRFFRRMGVGLERPLRLALLRAAMAAGHSEDAFRVGLRLLQEDQTAEERNQVIELMHGVLNRCEDRTAVLYRVFTDGACDVPLSILLANRYFQTRSYTRVLNLCLVALQERPADIYLHFVVGLSYLLASHQKAVKPREALVSAGVYYLSQYQSLLIAVDPSRTGEALYNAARAMHFLKLHYLCVPLYHRVAHDLAVPERCSLAVQRAARVNLYYIQAWEAGNRPLALAALPHVTPCADHARTAAANDGVVGG